MRESTKIGKRLMALFLVLLLSIESFAATVGDNDGAAFITKAEFDSLKNTFQAQVDQYNTSLDNKIDGAIAGYLAGVRVAKQENVKPLVENYSDIMWVRDYYMYGKWRKWTDRTSYTSLSTNDWYRPSLNEKRMTMRNGAIQIVDLWSTAFAFSFVRYAFSPTVFNDGIIMNMNASQHYSDTNSGLCPTAVFWQVKDSEGQWTIDTGTPIRNMYIMAPYLYVPQHDIGVSGTYAYQLGQNDAFLASLTPKTISGNQILYLENKLNFNGGSSNVTVTSNITNEMVDWPTLWTGGGPVAIWNGGNIFNLTQAYPLNTSWTVNNYFRTGCTWNFMDSSTVNPQVKGIRYLMLGKDCATKVNVAKYKNINQGERQHFDMSTSKEFATLSGNWSSGRYMETSRNTGTATPFVALGVTGSIGVPHWPTENLKEQTTGLLKYQGKKLKYGQGLPLVLDNQSNGYVQIQFDYDVKKILDDTTVNKKIEIDVKKTDFMLASGETGYVDDYVKDAYVGLVDPDTTTETVKTLHNYQINASDGKAKLTIPIKTDESLWFRIAPQDTTMGIYVGIKDLRITKITK